MKRTLQKRSTRTGFHSIINSEAILFGHSFYYRAKQASTRNLLNRTDEDNTEFFFSSYVGAVVVPGAFTYTKRMATASLFGFANPTRHSPEQAPGAHR